MGNNQTHHTIEQAPVEIEQQWAHSFPRSPPIKVYPHKVLPDRGFHQKLRPTNNGEILNSGGTLTGRHQQKILHEIEDKRNGIFRSSSISSNRPNEYQKDRSTTPHNRSYIQNQGDHLQKQNNQKFGYYEQRTREALQYRREQMKRFGSEPDLRNQIQSNNIESQDKFRGRKKYKAPQPPITADKKDDWDSNDGKEEIRKTRLFKTRAETKKKYSSPVNNRKHLNMDFSLAKLLKNKIPHRSTDNIYDSNRNSIDKNDKINHLHKAPIIPNFQAELLEVAKRMRNNNNKIDETVDKNTNDNNYKNVIDDDFKLNKDKLKTLDHNISKKENIRQKWKQIESEENFRLSLPIDGSRGQPSGKESTPEPSPPRIIQKDKNLPTKTFYFGMDKPTDYQYTNDNDCFVTSLTDNNILLPNSSGSDISSELDIDDSQLAANGIALQLRPILPKKQLEIPRFSPAAAWKLLSSMENNATTSTIPSDDGPVFIEDRIEKLSRPPPPPTIQIGPRSSHDKSGDSGISGDAGPNGFDENTEPVIINPNNIQDIDRQHGISWTPQQDLGDDESSLEDLTQPLYNSAPRFTPRPHVFSLSLPRDNQISIFMGDRSNSQASGLQKIKRSVSGVLGTLGNKKDVFQMNSTQESSENWFFSKSAPNSLNNGFNSLEFRRSQKSDEQENILVPTNNQTNHGRLMYLPNLEYNKNQRQSRSDCRNNYKDRSKSADRTKNNNKLTILSKSCENISIEIKSSSEPEDLQDPPKSYEDHWKINKPKRFTFQSTVRQIERKRLAEKLSREAEKKEKQRLRELEAMQKVEEEFQRKRAREKASIRQQLRLFSMDDTCSSLPPNLDAKKFVPIRSEPDGAVSSSTSSPTLPNEIKTNNNDNNRKSESKLRPYASSSEGSDDNKLKAQVTQVLSEYKQPSREYKEYRGNVRYINDCNEAKTTVHPQVTCKMPKATNYQGSNNLGTSSNYRKDFAHGVKKSGGGSVYSDDSQPNNKRYSTKLYNISSPITRF